MKKTTAEAIELLEEIARLMQLNDENPFKVRAFEKGAQSIAGQMDLADRAKAGRLTELPGVGKGIAEVLTEFLLKGTSTARDELMASLPPGLMELTRIPGLGPKKARALIEELQIHSLGELEYACRENRLLKIKGFGEKGQAKILEGIEQVRATEGRVRIVDAFPVAEGLLKELVKAVNGARHPVARGLRVSETGALRRRLEVLDRLEFLIELPPGEKSAADVRARAEEALGKFRSESRLNVQVELHFAPGSRFGYELARTTATEEHWNALGAPAPRDAEDEPEFFSGLGIEFIPPEAREKGEAVELARKGGIRELLPWDGVRGVFHNHTTRSDGTASLEEMVVAAKSRGYEYIGISDHSQSAFYAQGLKVPTLLEQEKEVREIQERHPEIRVFWGIESDILADGSLDYDEKTLKRFDFVIASIHSRFQMDRKAMTERILKAIRNPCTRFLGHATGRLLLGRKGYDLDMEAVIREAAEHDVAIEINSNPARLDIDWRWGTELRKRRTQVSVNPDAHEVEGLDDTVFGIAVARKALLPKSLVINSRSADEVAKWLARR